MYVLARVGGVPVLGLLIDVGALVSLFAGTLACITAAARVLMQMAHGGLAPGSLRNTHARNQTPSRAVGITGIAALLPVAGFGATRRHGGGVFRAGGAAGARWRLFRCRMDFATAPPAPPEVHVRCLQRD